MAKRKRSAGLTDGTEGSGGKSLHTSSEFMSKNSELVDISAKALDETGNSRAPAMVSSSSKKATTPKHQKSEQL
jgi:hypothetical protein